MSNLTKLWQSAWLQKWGLRRLLPLLIVCLALLILWVDQQIASGGEVYSDINHISPKPVALVLGTKPRPAKHKNSYYWKRLEGAAALFLAGKVRALIVSGDNGRVSYNEPDQMKADLITLGVPADYIHCDYAGFDTLDSVQRLDKVFQQRSYIVVSQDFHVRRALYIAAGFGHDASGFAVAMPSGYRGLRLRLREVLARFKAFLEVYVFHSQAKFLGRLEPVRLCC